MDNAIVRSQRGVEEQCFAKKKDQTKSEIDKLTSLPPVRTILAMFKILQTLAIKLNLEMPILHLWKAGRALLDSEKPEILAELQLLITGIIADMSYVLLL